MSALHCSINVNPIWPEFYISSPWLIEFDASGLECTPAVTAGIDSNIYTVYILLYDIYCMGDFVLFCISCRNKVMLCLVSSFITAHSRSSSDFPAPEPVECPVEWRADVLFGGGANCKCFEVR